MKGKMQILDKVDIKDLIRIHVFMGQPTKEDPLPYRVMVEPIQKTKHIIWDESALATFNAIVTEKCQQFDDGRDPRVIDYIKEFTERMMSELHRNGLIVLEDIPEGSDDPYATVKKYANRIQSWHMT